MNHQQAATILAHKQAAWPAAEMDPAGAAVWLGHLVELDHADVALGAMKYLERTVSSPFGPTIAELHERYAAALAALPALKPATVECAYCDGNHWTDHAGGAIPCPRCNQALHERWASGELRAKTETHTRNRSDVQAVARYMAEARLAMVEAKKANRG